MPRHPGAPPVVNDRPDRGGGDVRGPADPAAWVLVSRLPLVSGLEQLAEFLDIQLAAAILVCCQEGVRVGGGRLALQLCLREAAAIVRIEIRDDLARFRAGPTIVAAMPAICGFQFVFGKQAVRVLGVR